MQPVLFSTDDYVLPEWSALPKYSFHLQIIKEGSIMGNIDLKKKQFILVGRVNELCDLYIDNPSVSRKHAIIQFKENQDCPYIYDLGGTHGTQVNKKKLPPRAFQKIKPFDMIKFGVSSRYYILRCPQIEHNEIVNEDEADNKFEQILAQRKKQLSKQQMKQKYIDLLQNDPYFKSNNLSRKLQGSQGQRGFNGIDWGISDQYDVYAYRNQSQFQLEPDIIRRLPGLDQIQLNRISQFQTNLKKYQQIQSELNQLTNKEKRQFGLQEKLRDKKQKLQKKFVEAIQLLQKSQDWIRVNLFGEKEAKILRKQKAEKEGDTFEDDEFFDRTLTAKRQKKQKQLIDTKQKNSKQYIFTTDDFWKLQKQFRSELQNLVAIQKQTSTQNIQETNRDGREGIDQQDELDAFMKQNNQNLQVENSILLNQRVRICRLKITEMKNKLVSILGFAQVKKIEDQQRGIRQKQGETEQQKKMKKQIENRKRISDVLDQLDIIKQTQEQIDQEDVKIFSYYKKKARQEEDEQQNNKRGRQQQLSEQQRQYEQKPRKMAPGQNWSRDKDQEDVDEQRVYDLTKLG